MQNYKKNIYCTGRLGNVNTKKFKENTLFIKKSVTL